MATLDDLVADVAAEKTIIASLAASIQGLRDQIAAIPGLTPGQQAQIDVVFSGMEENKAAIAAAMVANTPPVV